MKIWSADLKPETLLYAELDSIDQHLLGFLPFFSLDKIIICILTVTMQVLNVYSFPLAQYYRMTHKPSIAPYFYSETK